MLLYTITKIIDACLGVYNLHLFFLEYVGELRIFVLKRRKRFKYKRNHSPLGPERGVGVTSLLGLLQAK